MSELKFFLVLLFYLSRFEVWNSETVPFFCRCRQPDDRRDAGKVLLVTRHELVRRGRRQAREFGLVRRPVPTHRSRPKRPDPEPVQELAGPASGRRRETGGQGCGRSEEGHGRRWFAVRQRPEAVEESEKVAVIEVGWQFDVLQTKSHVEWSLPVLLFDFMSMNKYLRLARLNQMVELSVPRQHLISFLLGAIDAQNVNFQCPWAAWQFQTVILFPAVKHILNCWNEYSVDSPSCFQAICHVCFGEMWPALGLHSDLAFEIFKP